VKRILSVLTLEGFVSQSEKSKQYYLGYEFYEAAKKSFPVHIQDKYRHILEQIAKQTGDTVYLVIPSGLDQLCIDVAEGSFSIRIPYGVGSRAPLGLLAGGIPILANLPQKKVEEILTKNQQRYIEYDLTIQEIWKHIEKCRKMGYLRYESKLIAGLTGVAVPIINNKEVVASIIVSSTAQRMPPVRCNQIQQLIRKEIQALNFDSDK
jgi:DNA-binding IclR family transcriptional regulator